MRHRLTFLLALILTCACGAEPDPIAETTAPLYVDVTGGGHGPFACVGPTPERGYVDIFDGYASYQGNCERWRGDFADGTGYQHVGYVVHPDMWVTSMRVSHGGADQTLVHVCVGQAALPGGCDSNGGFATTTDVPDTGFAPTSIRIQYTSYCPVTAAFTHLQQGAGAAAIEDGSQLATVRITDAFGNPLFESNTNSLAVDCVTYLPTRLMSQFTPPPGYRFGNEAVAVYTYP